MVSKKSILWLTVVVVVAVGTTLVLRHQHQKRKAAELKAVIAAPEKKEEKSRKEKSEPEDEPPDKPEPPEKVPKATVLSPAAKAHLAEQAFISALRTVLIWQGSQPANPQTSQVVLEKLSAIACDDLSPDLKSAWQSLLQAWRSLSDPAKVADPQLKAQGQQAADTLNTMLKAHGDGDIVL